MKHTPGPWHIYTETRIKTPVNSTDKHVALVAYGFGVSEEEHRANALLVAAAPDLLEALDAMLDWALANRGTEDEFVTCRSDGDVHHPTLDAARAAIAKATERQG